ncbi:hypothetical protein VTO42DRAFT_899 [Malbranchea cinnamomea]
MHKPSIAQLVYNALYPRPRASDPTSFAAYIARNLVPEVRTETSNFYGNMDCIEAQYPGLDYSFPPHRRRLSRFQYHRKLFKVFDELGLTETEIASLCRWEGTKSAKERYEREEGVTIRDTTMDTISVEPPHIPPKVHIHSWEEIATDTKTKSPRSMKQGSFQVHDSVEESSDDGIESYGARLNERLLEVTAAREQGANATNEELELFEQWLKEAVERGGYSDLMDAVREGRPIYRDATVLSQFYSPSSMSPPPQAQANLNMTRQTPTVMVGGALISGHAPAASSEPPIEPPQSRRRTAR